MPTRRAFILGGAAASVASIASRGASAQTFPDRPVRIVVAFPPGGNVDLTARMVAPAMSQLLGQPIVVENRAGAGGIVGTEAVARARPDGYQLLLTPNAPVSVLPVAMARLPYDPQRDFAPIGVVFRVPIVLLVSRELGVRNLAEFVARAKATPGGLSVGSAGNGSGAHLAIELFNAGTGAGLVHVPYRGTGPALSDLVAGTIPAVFDQLSSAARLHADGRARIIAVASAERQPQLPEVETLREANIVQPELSTTLGLLAPAGTPPAVVETIRSALAAALSDAGVRQRLGELGAIIAPPADIHPARYAAVIVEEMETARRAVQLGNIRLE